MIDFSHANSGKEFTRQIEVGGDVGWQIASGHQAIIGVMIESHLKAGRQDLPIGQILSCSMYYRCLPELGTNNAAFAGPG
jgi:3-deoxy-7-phosphoheptulonate synthase